MPIRNLVWLVLIAALFQQERKIDVDDVALEIFNDGRDVKNGVFYGEDGHRRYFRKQLYQTHEPH